MRYNGLYIMMLLFSGLLASPQSMAQDERRHVREGVTHLQKEQFSEAEQAFKKALEIKPNSFEAGYNLATALFRQEKYSEAMQQLQASEPFAGEDKQKLAQLYHNLGNNYIYSQDIDNGIEAYKKALRQNPLDDETRYNLIAAMKMKQEQEQEQEQKQQEEQQEEQEQEQEQQPEEQQQQEQQQQQQQQQSEGISRENAERLLEAIEQDEKEIMEKMNQHEDQQPVQIDKNW